jgi:CheY-like chemotaxis protein
MTPLSARLWRWPLEDERDGVTNAVDGEAFVQAREPDVILRDLMMPGMASR